MKLEDRDKMNQVIGMLLAIETIAETIAHEDGISDGISTVAHDAGFLLGEILNSERPLTTKEEGK